MSAKVLNLNIGVLGHVDSGKTSLAKALSTISSTAAFDKNPQSQERGITIDLGFSSLIVELPSSLQNLSKWEKLQFTLVDCPGHASLIRTVIGGAQIIDMVMLVIDITKGMQTQTAECLIIAEITSRKMIVILNKIDLLPESKRASMIDKMEKKMKATLEKTVFKDAPIVCIAANPGSVGDADAAPLGVQKLIDKLQEFAFEPKRDLASPFLYCVDHCFSIRGQGTVMTGTVLQGIVRVNDTVEIPSLRVSKKVKSMQMFRQPLECAQSGDRLGLCVTQFDPKFLERGIVSSPGYVPTILAAIVSTEKIKYFKGEIKSKSKLHISIGHETVMAKLTVFGSTISTASEDADDEVFDFNPEYIYQDQLLSAEAEHKPPKQYALLEFERPILAVPKCLIIGSKLDIDIHTNTCRLAFYGKLAVGFDDKNYTSTILPKLKIYKNSSKSGVVDRVVNEHEVIGKSMFKKETNIELFTGFKIKLSTGECGIIESSFGQNGKIKIRIPDGLAESTSVQRKKKGKSAEVAAGTSAEETAVKSKEVRILLSYKKYVFDPRKKMIQ